MTHAPSIAVRTARASNFKLACIIFHFLAGLSSLKLCIAERRSGTAKLKRHTITSEQ
jgi:hypothetical protein